MLLETKTQGHLTTVFFNAALRDIASINSNKNVIKFPIISLLVVLIDRVRQVLFPPQNHDQLNNTIFLSTLNENGNFTYTQADEK
jgi:hypothetical protein